MRKLRHLCGCALALLLGTGNALAEEVRIAVASNFADAIKEIAGRFEAGTPHKVTLIFGGSGEHYAQIRNGTPFEAFFSADAETPALLEREGRTLPDSRFTYAIGRLALWSPRAGLVDGEGKVLKTGGFRHLAMANPKLAPYGKAAEQVLVKLGH